MTLIVLLSSASAISAAVVAVGHARAIRRRKPPTPAERFLSARLVHLEGRR